MARYVAGDSDSTRACWYLAVGGDVKDGIGKFHRFMLSTDDAGMGFSWETEDVNYACESAPVTVMQSVKWEKTGVIERIVLAENTRGHEVSKYLAGLSKKALKGVAINEEYQTWVVYTDLGGEAGTGYARLCTIQMNTNTATAQEKRGHEFDILPVGDTVEVQVTAESVGETDNEITITTSAAPGAAALAARGGTPVKAVSE